jgi:hypothetical protein
MFFSFKTVGELQVIHQPLYRPKQIRAGEYAVGRKIGLERDKNLKKNSQIVGVVLFRNLTFDDFIVLFCM